MEENSSLKKDTKVISTTKELVDNYNEIKDKFGYFVIIGVPIPDSGNINFKCEKWISKQITQPNIISHTRKSRFCSEAYHSVIYNVLENFPFITHILLMDADEWPHDSDAIHYMVELDKDIVVAPTPIVKEGKGICWNVDKFSPYAEDFGQDFYKWEDLPEKPFRANFSGGPWLIKREVFEKMEWPYFKDIFDREKRKMGQDLYFDWKARQNGFEIWCEPKAKFHHARICDLYLARKLQDEINTHGLNWGSFAIDVDDWKFLENVVKTEKVKTVLEFGSGLSTLLFNDIGVKIDSFDDNHEFAIKRVRSRSDSKDIKLIDWDGKKCNPPRKKYDLCFIDGPVMIQSGGKIGRENSIRIAAEYSDMIAIHDCDKDEIKKLEEKYLKPNFNVYGVQGIVNLWKRK